MDFGAYKYALDRPLAQLLSANVIGAGGLGFDFQADQIDTVSPPLRRFFGAVLSRRLSRGDGFR